MDFQAAISRGITMEVNKSSSLNNGVYLSILIWIRRSLSRPSMDFISSPTSDQLHHKMEGFGISKVFLVYQLRAVREKGLKWEEREEDMI